MADVAKTTFDLLGNSDAAPGGTGGLLRVWRDQSIRIQGHGIAEAGLDTGQSWDFRKRWQIGKGEEH